ncbi:lysophospholipid acyltransferase family protein [Kiloniella sp. EL199]|uniref:lysophospholipid acyltransferase family protein n=1 Tax=Kiloniella sp. EL199 TaxID=2107581 RepID=UPI000EA26670|nr:lysophospholipid acyltransferase family protein [Kiloniella sp. EL199]
MKLSKRILRSTFFQNLIARLISSYISLVRSTVRWQEIVPDETRKYLEGDSNIIGCFWHARMIMMFNAWKGSDRSKFHMLISAHRDGRVIAKSIENLGFSTVEGSSRRGGATALVNLKRTLDKGGAIGITPDGPKGPRMRAKTGAIKAAQMTGRPILPVTGTVASRKVFNSWDRFVLPAPFTKGVIIWGTPIYVERDASKEQQEKYRLELEDQLNKLTQMADQSFRQNLIYPDPISIQEPSTQSDTIQEISDANT